MERFHNTKALQRTSQQLLRMTRGIYIFYIFDFFQYLLLFYYFSIMFYYFFLKKIGFIFDISYIFLFF